MKNILTRHVSVNLLTLGVCILTPIMELIFHHANENTPNIKLVSNGFDSNTMTDLISVLCAIIAVIFAFLAHKASVTARNQNSFDTLFSQLLAGFSVHLQKEIEYNVDKLECVIRSNSGSGKSIVIDKKVDVAHNFYNYYRACFESTQNEIDLVQINKVWKRFCESLTIRDDFEIRFRYLYTLIKTVANSPLEDKQKVDYINIIQSQLSAENLLCYYCNILCFSKGNRNDSTVELLRKYGFFNDFYKNEVYEKCIKDSIDYKLMSIFNED